MLTPLDEAETSQIGGMEGERGDRDMEPGMGSGSCGLLPCFSSFLNFDLLFWNQILTCGEQKIPSVTQTQPAGERNAAGLI